jgi:hypothetical protein
MAIQIGEKMTSFKHSDTEIGIYKEWRRNLGWLATASYKESKYGLKAEIINFISTKPFSEEDKARNFKRKVNKQIGKVPSNYSGLIVSSSPHQGKKCERWCWWAQEGKLVANAETIEEVISKAAIALNQ